MVHACLRSGLRKEPILEIIRAVQDPVKDEGTRQMQMQLHMHMPPPPAPPPAPPSISAPPVLDHHEQPQEEGEEEEENEEAARVEGDLEYPKDVSARARGVFSAS